MKTQKQQLNGHYEEIVFSQLLISWSRMNSELQSQSQHRQQVLDPFREQWTLENLPFHDGRAREDHVVRGKTPEPLPDGLCGETVFFCARVFPRCTRLSVTRISFAAGRSQENK